MIVSDDQKYLLPTLAVRFHSGIDFGFLLAVSLGVPSWLLEQLGEWALSERLLARSRIHFSNPLGKGVGCLGFGGGGFLVCFYRDVCSASLWKSFHPVLSSVATNGTLVGSVEVSC